MRYRDDKMKLNEELSKLYKKEGVNPLGWMPSPCHPDANHDWHFLRNP